MSILLAYLDYKSADIVLRERLSFTQSAAREAMKEIQREYDLSGVVLLSTCNRTELYISTGEGERVNPAEILCRQAGLKEREVLSLFNIEYDDGAVRHLMEVACGLQSMVLCEDQIITQVKNAALMAREEKTTDSVLETLFRLAITAAKKAKTEVQVRAVPTSAAQSAIDFLTKRYDLKNKKVLVIGNGETGRLCCNGLKAAGAEVAITLRKYRHGENTVPRGCGTVDYDERIQRMSAVDVVVSATASPHYTVTHAMVAGLDKKPRFFIDLALPRDIEPSVADIAGVTCYNLDQICGDTTKINGEEIAKIEEIISCYHKRFENWRTFAAAGCIAKGRS